MLPLEMAVGLALLVVPFAMLVVAVPTYLERQSMARLAAQEAARTVAVAADWSQGAADAQALARQIAVNHEVPAEDLTLSLTPGALVRGGTVTATATVRMPLVTLPAAGTLGGFGWSATHTEAVDAYRSL